MKDRSNFIRRTWSKVPQPRWAESRDWPQRKFRQISAGWTLALPSQKASSPLSLKKEGGIWVVFTKWPVIFKKPGPFGTGFPRLSFLFYARCDIRYQTCWAGPSIAPRLQSDCCSGWCSSTGLGHLALEISWWCFDQCGSEVYSPSQVNVLQNFTI